MHAAIVSALCGLLLVSCAATPQAPSAATSLSPAQKTAIGKKIWQNESGGTISGLTAWNTGEEFPSLGIGHFIWYPAGFNGRFRESWPDFIAFAERNGANPPASAKLPDAPWKSRAEFLSKSGTPEMTGLRNW
ncbi:MAG TPA: hypothetical protein VLO11_02505, partial [Luteolibacter sp.]|nr:hypothetical protein [Luteolibacter sp.]